MSVTRFINNSNSVTRLINNSNSVTRFINNSNSVTRFINNSNSITRFINISDSVTRFSTSCPYSSYYAGTTPERAEYEASIDLSAEEGGGGNGGAGGGNGLLNIIDEDEWTDLNFGTNNNSTNCANTSDDSISDLDSDQGRCWGQYSVIFKTLQYRYVVRSASLKS